MFKLVPRDVDTCILRAYTHILLIMSFVFQGWIFLRYMEIMLTYCLQRFSVTICIPKILCRLLLRIYMHKINVSIKDLRVCANNPRLEDFNIQYHYSKQYNIAFEIIIRNFCPCTQKFPCLY